MVKALYQIRGDMVMSSYQNYKNKALQNPEVKKEYDALQPEYEKALKDLKISENEKNSK